MPPIDFPGLGFQIQVEREIIKGLPIQWYGLCIALGFLLATFYCAKRAPRFGIKGDPVIDMLFFAVPAAIIGARLYYVIFDWSSFRLDANGDVLPFGKVLVKTLQIWNGGVAIYGAVIAAVLTAVIYCRIRKINPLAMLDVGALGLLIGQAIGRWGNFYNQEVYGIETSLPWRMGIRPELSNGVFSSSYIYVHPLFFYESLWNVLGLIVLHFLSKKRKYNGETFLQYLVWYGTGRALLESIRDSNDSLRLFNTDIRVSLLLSAIVAVIGLALLIFNATRKHDPSKLIDLTLVEAEASVETEVDDDAAEESETLPEDTDEPETLPEDDNTDDTED